MFAASRFSCQSLGRLSRGFNTYSHSSPSRQLQQTLTHLKLEIASEQQVGQQPMPTRSAIDGRSLGITFYEESKISFLDKKARALVASQQLSRIPWQTISQFHMGLRSTIEKEVPVLAFVPTLEVGKSLHESEVEWKESMYALELAASIPNVMTGQTYPAKGLYSNESRLYPLSMSAQIGPVNFPVSILVKHLAMSMGVGCPMLVNPSELGNVSATVLKMIYDREIKAFNAGRPYSEHIPEDSFQLVYGGAKVEKQLADSQDIPVIVATGSTGMVQDVARRAGVRRTVLEGAGNNPVIVTPSAIQTPESLRKIAEETAFSGWGMSGQRCTSLRVIAIQEPFFTQFVDEHRRIQQSYVDSKVGDPRDSKTEVGPLFTGQALTIMQSKLKEAKASGAEVFGGDVLTPKDYEEGAYVAPGGIVHSNGVFPHLFESEVFAPLIHYVPIKSLSEGLGIVSQIPAGLACSLYTNQRDEEALFLKTVGPKYGVIKIDEPPTRTPVGGAGFKGGGGNVVSADGRVAGAAGVLSAHNFVNEPNIYKGYRYFNLRG